MTRLRGSSESSQPENSAKRVLLPEVQEKPTALNFEAINVAKRSLKSSALLDFRKIQANDFIRFVVPELFDSQVFEISKSVLKKRFKS